MKGMNLKRVLIALHLVFLGSLLLAISWAPFALPERVISRTPLGARQAFLEINGNGNFTGYPGNGSKVNPYRIEDLAINGSETYGILIMHTNAYFIIQNCSIREFDYSVYLLNVTFGELYNCSFASVNSFELNIYMDHSHNNTIRNNTILGAGGSYGILLGNSDNNTISYNNVTNHSENILLTNSNHNHIIENVISNAISYGIRLSGSNYNFIKRNIFNCNYLGPWMEVLCEGNVFEGNTITPCEEDSIPGFGLFAVLAILALVVVALKPRRGGAPE